MTWLAAQPSGNPAAEDQDALTTPNQFVGAALEPDCTHSVLLRRIVSKTEDTSIVVAILGQSPAVSNTYLEPLFVRGPAKLSIVYEGEGYGTQMLLCNYFMLTHICATFRANLFASWGCCSLQLAKLLAPLRCSLKAARQT